MTRAAAHITVRPHVTRYHQLLQRLLALSSEASNPSIPATMPQDMPPVGGYAQVQYKVYL